tara:strand:+ start:7693 stop:8319 length:627 start_codon:yes stop_codon:yes gene_type:complete
MTYNPDNIFAPIGDTTGESSIQMCDWPGCKSEAEHRAPRSREYIREYRWFCLEHVRIYNRSWNYYEGMSDEQVDRLVRSDTTWNRPTWPLGDRRNRASQYDFDASFGPGDFGPGFENLDDPFGFFTAETSFKHAANTAPKTSLSAAERAALATLDLDVSVTVIELKARYKLLVKRYHPDVTGGDKKSEERFKQINEAYETIMNCLLPE